MQKPQFVAQAESAALDRPYLPLADAILARMGLSLVRASGPVMPLPGWVAVGGSLAGNDISNFQGDRSVRDAVDHNESKGHLDIKFAPALVQRARQGRTSLKLLDAARHRVIEPAPVRRAKMLRHDQIETLPDRLRGAEPEQRRRDSVSTA